MLRSKMVQATMANNGPMHKGSIVNVKGAKRHHTKTNAPTPDTVKSLNDRVMWLPSILDFVSETCKEGFKTDQYEQFIDDNNIPMETRGLLLYPCANGARVKKNMFLCEVTLGEPKVVRCCLKLVSLFNAA